jgi:hypothetical protein
LYCSLCNQAFIYTMWKPNNSDVLKCSASVRKQSSEQKACDIAKKDPYNEKQTTAKPGKWLSAVTLWVLQQNVDGQPHSATPW